MYCIWWCSCAKVSGFVLSSLDLDCSRGYLDFRKKHGHLGRTLMSHLEAKPTWRFRRWRVRLKQLRCSFVCLQPWRSRAMAPSWNSLVLKLCQVELIVRWGVGPLRPEIELPMKRWNSVASRWWWGDSFVRYNLAVDTSSIWFHADDVAWGLDQLPDIDTLIEHHRTIDPDMGGSLKWIDPNVVQNCHFYGGKPMILGSSIFCRNPQHTEKQSLIISTQPTYVFFWKILISWICCFFNPIQ